MTTKNCTICGESFGCGADVPGVGCWCNDFPPIVQPDPEVDCRCPKCLKTEILQKIEDCIATVTPEKARDSVATRYRTDANPIEGIDYYINEDGLYVFTRWYHLKRGNCCGNACRHCPYGHEAVLRSGANSA